MVVSIDYMIDASNRRADSTADPGGGSLTYSCDDLLTGVGRLILTRDPTTGFLSGTQIDTVTDAYGYDPTYGELSSYSASQGGAEFYSVTYPVRDALGRIKQKVETIGGVTDTYDYTYDTAGRLEDVQKNGSAFAHYDYGANSNRESWTGPWGSGSATYDDQDRLQTYGGLSYTYTANGELTSKTDGSATVTYDYDVAGNLRQLVLDSGVTIDYVIDASNRRVGKKVGGWSRCAWGGRAVCHRPGSSGEAGSQIRRRCGFSGPRCEDLGRLRNSRRSFQKTWTRLWHERRE